MCVCGYVFVRLTAVLLEVQASKVKEASSALEGVSYGKMAVSFRI